MLIVEIPFVLIEITLMKFKVKREWSLEKKYIIYFLRKKQRLKGIIFHISIYSLLLILIILGFINTIWISMELIKTDKVKNFLKVFFLSQLIGLLIFESSQIIIKSFVFYLITKDDEMTIWKKALLFSLTLMPWVFILLI